jgi:hypothetical protein
MRRLLLLLSSVLLSGGPAWAVTPNSIVTMQEPKVGVVQFLQGTDNAGTYKTVFTAGASGSKCNALWSTNDDSTTLHVLTIQLARGGIRYGGVAVITASNQGYSTGIPALNLLSPTLWPGLPLDSDGNPYLQLQSGDSIQATFATALTTATRINLIISCGDF